MNFFYSPQRNLNFMKIKIIRNINKLNTKENFNCSSSEFMKTLWNSLTIILGQFMLHLFTHLYNIHLKN